MASSPSPESRSTVRPYRPEDESAVRDLIDADRLPGQPHCLPGQPTARRNGAAPLSGWAAPARPRISVLVDAGDRARGIVAYLSWADVRTGLICRLHARENPPALRALIRHALGALAHCLRVEAFVDAPAVDGGLVGLPRTRRAATHDALVRSGFTGRRQGCYLHRSLPAEVPSARVAVDVLPCEMPHGRRLIIREAAEPVAEAVIGVGPDRTATIHWIETLPSRRRRGLARLLLGQALALLAEEGATEVSAVLDDAQQRSPGRAAASRLFDSFGFTFVDDLWGYQRQRPRATRQDA
jgi:ribosomal protein S18 acetylase RimI-like enzyme